MAVCAETQAQEAGVASHHLPHLQTVGGSLPPPRAAHPRQTGEATRVACTLSSFFGAWFKTGINHISRVSGIPL